MKESRILEFKQDISNTFLKTVSAFANFGKGAILFGVDDNGNAIGIPDPDAMCLNIENKINDSITPKPDYTISVNRRNNVITLNVSEGKYKPYLYKGKAYRRSDTATIEVDPIELRRLTLEGANLYYEGLPCEEDQLSFEYFETKLIEIMGIRTLSEDMLRTFGFLTDDNRFNNAASLFSDTNKFPGIDIAKFGESISEIMDRETIEGKSILRQYDLSISMFRRYYQYEKIEGFKRVTMDTIPEEAFREAIANALVHRTWDIDSHIRIAMFADRIEITSPGGLPKGITREEYLDGYISNLRNPIIGNIFFRLHYIEMFGTGIRRIMESYADEDVTPVFEITDNTVRVILPCKNRKNELSTDAYTVLETITDGSLLSSREIADKLNWSKDKVIRMLNILSDAGSIKKIGNGRGTKYRRI